MSQPQNTETDRLFQGARGGSTACLGQLLTQYANYFKLLATAQLDSRLRARVSPSDVVQEVFFEAHRDFDHFRGETTAEFSAWLRKILVNNLLRVIEQHVHAEKRDVRREVSMQVVNRQVEESTARLELLAREAESPSGHLLRKEREIELADAIAKLSEDYREIIVLRHVEGLPFEEVAQQMQRTAGAVRMLWLRALKALRTELVQAESGD